MVDTLFLTRVWTHRQSSGRGKRHHRTRIKRSRFKSYLWAVYHYCTLMSLFITLGRTMATVLVCPFTHLTRVAPQLQATTLLVPEHAALNKTESVLFP